MLFLAGLLYFIFNQDNVAIISIIDNDGIRRKRKIIVGSDEKYEEFQKHLIYILAIVMVIKANRIPDCRRPKSHKTPIMMRKLAKVDGTKRRKTYKSNRFRL